MSKTVQIVQFISLNESAFLHKSVFSTIYDRKLRRPYLPVQVPACLWRGIYWNDAQYVL